jgi:sporulation protein YlmC with PRC-barrel domain
MNAYLILKLACCTMPLLGPAAGSEALQDATQAGASHQIDEIRKVSALLDAEVQNAANEKIADVEDLVLSPEGEVRYAILGRGGLAGVGADYIAVPWDSIDVKFLNGKWAVNLAATKDLLDRAPKLEAAGYDDLSDPGYLARVHEFFKPRDGSAQRGAAVPALLRASKIDDAKLMTSQNEHVGEVEDLLLDRHDHAAYAIIGRGGVLGIGEDYVAVPWSKMRLSAGRENDATTAVIDATKQQLEQAPLIKGDDYTTLLGPGFAAQLDRYFGVDRTAVPRE